MDAEFADRLEAVAGTLHLAPDLETARATARGLIGDATVARWADPPLEGIADREAPAEEAEVSLIRADVGVADTGAIGFVHRTGRPRAAGLLPDRQIALLAREDLVQTMAEALTRVLASNGTESFPAPSNVVFACGPSRTADIEQRMMLGVHAPRSLDVVLYG